MKAVEVIGRVDARGQLILDQPLECTNLSVVRVIILYPEAMEEPTHDFDESDDSEEDLDELKMGGKTRPNPLSDLWERCTDD